MTSKSRPVDKDSEIVSEKYALECIAGQGTFGTVQLGKEKTTGHPVAIKRVIQDPRFRNRELEIMQDISALRHPNIVQLQAHFYTSERNGSDVYLNVVMDYVPTTLYRFGRRYFHKRAAPPNVMLKIFTYQLLRSIAVLQLPSINVCHRDIKPQNVLVNEATGELKLCDFGSSKRLSPSEPNVAYICSRYYRAPELIFGNKFYTCAVDVWAVGCVFAEMMLGDPLFRGDCSRKQLQEIVKVLGPLTSDEMRKLNPTNVSVSLPSGAGIPWEEVFGFTYPPEAYDLLNRLLRYLPEDRLSPFDAMCHEFFDDLHDPATRMPDGKSLPTSLLEFLPEEVAAMTKEQKEKLIRK